MGNVAQLARKVLLKIPEADRQQVEELSILLDKTQDMALLGASVVGSPTMPIATPPPSSNPKYFKLSGEAHDASMIYNAGMFWYSDNLSTLVTQIDNAGYIFNEQGSDIDFRIEGDADTQLFNLDAGSDVIAMGGAVDASFKLAIRGQQLIDHTATEALLVRKNSDGGDVFNINTTNVKASVGIAAGDGTFHVHTATAGDVTANVNYDDLVIENSTTGGMSILVPNASNAQITLGSLSDSVGAIMRWNYDGNLLNIGTAKSGTSAALAFMTANFSERARIDGAGDMGIAVTSMSAQLHIDQKSSTGAQPVLFLDQGDASEQAIVISYDAADVDMILIDVDVTGDPQIKWDESEDMFAFTKGILINSNNELRFYDNGNYVGFEAPALSADQIWILPTADGNAGDALTTDGSGALSWLSGGSEKTWSFRSRAGASGTTYAGGFYLHSGTANDFSGGPTFGTANSSYAAHFFIVTGANTVDELTLTVTGTTITDSGTYNNTPDTENIVIPNSTLAGAYYETSKKWLGQVTITVASGTAKTCDFGFAKYWDNNNTDYKVTGLEATWLGGATDTAPNLILRHHNGTAGNTDWTYTGSGATPPTAIAAMATDHSTTEDNVVSGENGAWKRSNLSTDIDGSGSEGTIVEIVTTANKAFELGNFLLRIVPQ